jgi:hypothetical protein
MQRLELVKLEGREKKAAAGPGATAAAAAAAPGQQRAVFDAPAQVGAEGGRLGSSIHDLHAAHRATPQPAAPERAPPRTHTQDDIYAAPPSLSETLMDRMNSDISDPALR